MDTFNKLEIPDEIDRSVMKEFELPPWNGIGSFEDSEMNCRMVLPEPPKKDFYKILVKGRSISHKKFIRTPYDTVL